MITTQTNKLNMHFSTAILLLDFNKYLLQRHGKLHAVLALNVTVVTAS